MAILSIRASLIVSLALTCSHAQADDAYDACKLMTAKLAASYEIHWNHQNQKRTKPAQDISVEDAENIVFSAFLLTKEQLEEKWPTFYEWSVLTVIRGAQQGRDLFQLRTDAFLSCIERYSKSQ